MHLDRAQLASRYLYGTTLAFVTTGLIVHGLNTWTDEFFAANGEKIFTIHWSIAAVLFVASRTASLVAPNRRIHDWLDGYVGGMLLVAFVVHTAHAAGVGGRNGAEIFASMHWGTAFLMMTAATFLRLGVSSEAPLQAVPGRKPTPTAVPMAVFQGGPSGDPSRRPLEAQDPQRPR